MMLKFGFVYEALEQGRFEILVFIAAVPYVARVGMLVYFVSMKTSKQTGLAFYFKGQVITKLLM